MRFSAPGRGTWYQIEPRGNTTSFYYNRSRGKGFLDSEMGFLNFKDLTVVYQGSGLLEKSSSKVRITPNGWALRLNGPHNCKWYWEVQGRETRRCRPVLSYVEEARRRESGKQSNIQDVAWVLWVLLKPEKEGDRGREGERDPKGQRTDVKVFAVIFLRRWTEWFYFLIFAYMCAPTFCDVRIPFGENPRLF